MIIDNTSSKKFRQFKTIATRRKSKRNKIKETLVNKIIIDNTSPKKFKLLKIIAIRCKSKRNTMKEILVKK